MPRLKVLLRGTSISDVVLQQDREIIAGRKDSCDLVLQAEKGISREHFKIKFEEGQWIIQSLSRFGEVFFNGQRIDQAILNHGDSFLVPPYEFLFQDIPEQNLAQDSSFQSDEFNDDEKTIVGVVSQIPFIKVVDSQGVEKELLRLEMGDSWIAGRDATCSIVINDERVSRRQFEIRKINKIYTIIDLASVNGTFVNGSPVSSTDPQPLKSGDVITVLDNSFYFELHDPNFENRIENIEIPQLNLDSGLSEIDENSQELSEEEAYFDNADYPYDQAYEENDSYQNQLQISPNVFAQGDVNQQIPFQGTASTTAYSDQNFSSNSQNSDTNQFTKSAQSKINPFEKIKQSKPLLISVVLLILGGAYYLSEMINTPETGDPTTQVASDINSQDPFFKLSVDDQEKVKLWYSNVDTALRQQSFSIAKENVDKIHQLLPDGYKDSKAFELEAMNGEQTLIAQQEEEIREKEQAEMQEKLKTTLAQCEKSITSQTTVVEIENCLIPATEIDPAHPEREKLIAKVRTQQENMKQQREREEYEKSQTLLMESVFLQAEEVHKQGYPKKTIAAYKKVLETDLPDPENYKETAKKRIALIENKLIERNTKNITDAEIFIKEGKLKLGINALKEALLFDPENENIKNKIEKYTYDLNHQVKLIYQESVIDENFGNVEGSESRPGAKDKWKKILDTDLEDGEYFRKAYVKLKKYGAL